MEELERKVKRPIRRNAMHTRLPVTRNNDFLQRIIVKLIKTIVP